MAVYTIKIRDMVRNGWEPPLNDYPIFDENYRKVLNDKIINHFYMEEIGLETVALFDHHLRNKMNEIMPQINFNYEIQKKLLENIDPQYIEKYTSKTDSKGDTSSDTTSSGKDSTTSHDESRFSDTPMQEIKNIDSFLTNASKGKSGSTGESSTKGNMKSKDTRESKQEYEREVVDSEKAIKQINDVKRNFMNIDMLVINQLKSLFMGIY